MALKGPLIVGISGFELNSEEREILKHPLISGVILFGRNYHDPEQLFALTQSIQHLREPKLLVTVDQEGGRVQRFKAPFSLLPPAGDIGKIYEQDPKLGLELSEAMGELMAMELRACGVDLSFAPVLDIDNGQSRVIGNRGFHANPAVVAQLAAAYAKGMKHAGMAAVGKHYPGHGSVPNDTHLETACDPRSLAQIESTDLVPFKELIGSGIEGIMAAHVSYPQVDKHPAGFSKIWLQDMLRNRLDFKGIIFSDDMGMMAAKQYGDIVDTVKSALQAGCDRILLCNEPDTVITVLDGLKPISSCRDNGMLGPNKAACRWQDLQKHPRWQALHRKYQVYFAKG